VPLCVPFSCEWLVLLDRPALDLRGRGVRVLELEGVEEVPLKSGSSSCMDSWPRGVTGGVALCAGRCSSCVECCLALAAGLYFMMT
jgi:hypothetical protein